MTNDRFSAALQAADVGPMFEGEFIAIDGQGKLRIYYNWLYSALNCDPGNNDTFLWQVSKVSDTAVALSPKEPYNGWRLYASVRPDWDYFVQVQAPHSADWITQARGDEHMTVNELGFLTINFVGFNGKYLALNSNQTSHDGLSGYKLQSNGAAAGGNTNFFVSVGQALQSKISLPEFGGKSEGEVAKILSENGLPNSEKLARQIVR